jgi:hypothetical protein
MGVREAPGEDSAVSGRQPGSWQFEVTAGKWVEERSRRWGWQWDRVTCEADGEVAGRGSCSWDG